MIEIRFTNNKIVAYAVIGVDGFYYLSAIADQEGLWSSEGLRYIAGKLDELNAPYVKYLEEHFK